MTQNDPTSGKPGTPYAGTALKALSVFDVIARSDRPIAFKDLIEPCGLPRATLHRMLSALTESGLVRYDPDQRTYWLGMRLIDLAGKIWERIDFSGAFARELDRLRKLTGDNAQIAAIEGFQIVYVDERDSFDEIRLYYMKGRRHPAYCTAMGKAILACLDAAELKRLVGANAMTAYTPRTITDLPALQNELALTRERQYAIDDEELEVGRRCVAAAILDHRNQAIAAIGLTGPADRMSVARCHELAPELIAAANRITMSLRRLGDAGSVERAAIDKPADPRVSCAFPGTTFIGDSPVWDTRARRLLWVDILAPAIHSGDPKTGIDTTTLMPSLVGSIVPREKGGLVAAMQTGLAFVSDRAEVTPIVHPEADKPPNRLNDGKCDSRGRFWFSSMSMQREPGKGALYRLDPDLKLVTVETGLTICNGPDWNLADNRMYLTDAIRNRVLVYPYDSATGAIGTPEILTQLPEDGGAPGGLAIDLEDHIWTPMWDDGEVLRIAPDGKIVTRIHVPALKPASVAFGGDDLGTLYVTSARIRMSATQIERAPLTGSVFAIRAGVRGRPPNRFAG
ncbi:MAG: SMP-30/gluconolactonase/LRE family protein [Proteobacteria bacterium]|nr:SMP-30/gluconolactonase/LRE family protein [Pseudomonadota bacterium]